VILLAGLGYALVRLIVDAFLTDAALIGAWRVSQVVAFVAALVIALILSRGDDKMSG
jgi:apolipoprotein N-acyltransferase